MTTNKETEEKSLEELKIELFEEISANEDEKNYVKEIFEIGQNTVNELESRRDSGIEEMKDVTNRMIAASKKESLRRAKELIEKRRELMKMEDDPFGTSLWVHSDPPVSPYGEL
ncbi:MAG: hypothetical protein ISR98_00170 [Parcubacteria group bacterium]|nr:hypothetical protein [Parcubacteria group bacterium]